MISNSLHLLNLPNYRMQPELSGISVNPHSISSQYTTLGSQLTQMLFFLLFASLFFGRSPSDRQTENIFIASFYQTSHSSILSIIIFLLLSLLTSRKQRCGAAWLVAFAFLLLLLPRRRYYLITLSDFTVPDFSLPILYVSSSFHFTFHLQSESLGFFDSSRIP